MAKTRVQYMCHDCGHTSVKWLGHCPGCGAWNTFEEFVESPKRTTGVGAPLDGVSRGKAMRIGDIPPQTERRFQTGLRELDRVLGGGIVEGSMLLLGGDPGIGKSTLLLQLSQTLAASGQPILYVSGEESVNQLKLRSERLGVAALDIHVLAETDLALVVQVAEQMRPGMLVIDSIQTVYHSEIAAAPGSVSQIRECTAMLLQLAKRLNIATFIVGHVTKEGNLAGPRMLEHMVDAVLYFEGERHHSYRVLRAVKNRFGSTNELAVFEMQEDGLREVLNPSEMFLSERHAHLPGSAVVAALEGTRPLLLEVQALVAPTSFGTPRRMATGADYNRMCLMIAVLERRLGLRMQLSDAYVNVAGGVHVDEPAVDLGLALALASSQQDKPLSADDVYIGEVGLTGEVRSVTRLEQRVREAEKLGFTRCLVPSQSLQGWTAPKSIEVVGVRTVMEALQCVL